MIKRIIGVTVGTPLSPSKLADKLKPVKTVNGNEPDGNGNVEVIGNDGKDGKDGKDGYTPIKGVDYFDGKDGKDGYTPIKGVDYFDGETGKTAFAYAQDGGFTGAEEEFADRLAKIPNWGVKKEYTPTDSVVIPEQTLMTGMWSNRQRNIAPGITYAVYIDGAIYFCTAYNSGSSVYLGNITLMTSGSTKPHNNEPFCIYWAGGTATAGMFFDDGTLSNPTLKVVECAEIEKPVLPEENLPEGVLTVADKAGIVAEVIASLPVYNGEAVTV